jgi:hypothetical protein
VVDKLLAAGAVLLPQPAPKFCFISAGPQSLESAITVGSIYPGAPTGLPSD